MENFDQKIYTVLEVNRLIKRELEASPLFRSLLVRGEIAGKVTLSQRGHLYFDLKDEASQIPCVMFSSYLQNYEFGTLEHGMKVICSGSITVYPQGGKYQLRVEEVFPEGLGRLYLAAEELKKRLKEEGLLDPERKRPLPKHPKRIGVVTSPVGAAIRDIVTVARRRYPNIEILLSPSLVQGAKAPASLVAALKNLYTQSDIDVIIIGRGGGSFEELNAFNHEDVVRTIAASPVPVVSAVGHETDYTIADLVADQRAPTPSAAAELVVPEKDQLCSRLNELVQKACRAMGRRLELSRRELARLTSNRYLAHPRLLIEDAVQKHDELEIRLLRYGPAAVIKCRPELTQVMHRLQVIIRALIRESRSLVEHTSKDLQKIACQLLKGLRTQFQGAAGKLQAYSPLKTLARGYSVCQDPVTGKVITAAGQVSRDQELIVKLASGSLDVTVRETYGEETT
ncbi:MAG: exodeoxyribonuclease VII large subunit [Firmicutes bacterium]|nr:exodeoxyribonuclease VII large subunit [Bacillota bacterium]